MKKALAAVLSTGILSLLVFDVSAACPVGKKIGDTWCEKGMMWKCEKCASQDCPIFTGDRCMKDDSANAQSLTPLEKLLTARPREKTAAVLPTIADTKPSSDEQK